MNLKELIILLMGVGLIIFGSLLILDNITCGVNWDCKILAEDKVEVVIGTMLLMSGLTIFSLIIGKDLDGDMNKILDEVKS